MNKRDIAVMNRLRENSRVSLSKMSKDLGYPVSTLFETVKKLEGDVVSRHVSLIKWDKLGFGIRVAFLMKASDKDNLRRVLMDTENVNNLTTSLEYDFYAECVFKSFKEMSGFKERVKEYCELKDIFILEELKREGFAISPEISD